MPKATTAKQLTEISRRADIVIGKDVIELLTSGMYLSPITIFREYVQNAADAIDEARSEGTLGADDIGTVEISFDQKLRTVKILDNGAGISAREAPSTLLAIGASKKRGTKARGFRGVGRLSGLAYCRELKFRTKAAGDSQVTTVTWDCRLLRTRLADAAFSGDLGAAIASVVDVQTDTAENIEEHFFEVTLSEVARHRYDALLNERLISRFLSQIAPVDFSPEFSFGPSIHERLATFGPRKPIRLLVDGAEVLRPYKDVLYQVGNSTPLRIESVEFRDLFDMDGNVGAVAWIGHHEYVRSIPVGLDVRGLRARIGDIQVGEANLFDELFKEPRFNGWSIGEVHAFDRRLVPNGRRDNFELTHHAYHLHAQLHPLALELSQRCRDSSVSRTGEQIIKNFLTDAVTRISRPTELSRADIGQMRAALARSRLKLASVHDETTRGALTQILDDLALKLPAIEGSEEAAVVPLSETIAAIMRLVTNREQARRLIEALREISA